MVSDRQNHLRLRDNKMEPTQRLVERGLQWISLEQTTLFTLLRFQQSSVSNVSYYKK